MEILETTTETPICPHCEKHIDRVYARKAQSKLGVRFLYFCGHCKKVLGVSHRKGFWMG
jgi:predicted SprT family Zn-dependent metalloprotease